MDISLIGLGPMGTALGRALLAKNYRLTVWNRTSWKAEPLVNDGAILADSAQAAIAASPLTILCLANYEAVENILDTSAKTLPGQSIVSLGSGTPSQARSMKLKVAEHRGRFLAGAIMIPPALIGRPEALFFYSGEEAVFSRHRDILKALGGDLQFLGEDPARALLYNTALLGLYWSTMVGFLHGAALVGTAGVPAEAFASTAAEFLTVPKQIMAYCARQVDGRNYSGEAGRLTMDATAIEHLVETSAAQGLASTLPDFLHHLAQKAIDKGHGDDSFASIIEVLRQKPRTHEGNGGPL